MRERKRERIGGGGTSSSWNRDGPTATVIMSHSARTVLRCFICILISVVMLIMRRCFLFPDVFVLPLAVANFAVEKADGVFGDKDEIFAIISAINRGAGRRIRNEKGKSCQRFNSSRRESRVTISLRDNRDRLLDQTTTTIEIQAKYPTATYCPSPAPSSLTFEIIFHYKGLPLISLSMSVACVDH